MPCAARAICPLSSKSKKKIEEENNARHYETTYMRDDEMIAAYVAQPKYANDYEAIEKNE